MTARLLFRRFRRWGFWTAAFLVAASASAEFKEIAPGLKAELSAIEAPEGGVIFVALESEQAIQADALSGKFEGKEFYFFPAESEKRFGAIFGVSHDLKPGVSEIELRVGEKSGKLSLKV